MSADGPRPGAGPLLPASAGPPPDPFAREEGAPPPRAWLASVAAACAALLALLASAVLVWQRLDVLLHAQEVPGRIVSVRERYDPASDAPVRTLSIRLQARPGKPIVVERQTALALREGQTVAMLVVDRPEDALLAHGYHPMGAPGGLALAGIALLAAAVMLRPRRGPGQAAAPPRIRPGAPKSRA